MDLNTLLPKEPLAFTAIQEPWSIYRLEDGTLIRVRPVLVKVINTGKMLENGKPELLFQFQQIMDVEPPDGAAQP